MRRIHHGREHIFAAQYPLHGLALLEACGFLHACVVVFQSFGAEHVGNELRRLVIAHSEELPHPRRAQEGLYRCQAVVRCDLTNVLPIRTWDDANAARVGVELRQGRKAAELRGFVDQHDKAARTRRAGFVELCRREEQA